MAALAKEFEAPTQHEDFAINYVQKGNTKVYSGGLVNTDASGYAVPAADVASHKCVGRAQMTSDTTAAGPSGLLADGVGSFDVVTGIFEYDNPAGANQLVQADVGKLAYVLDDHTVIRAAGTTNSIIAGRVLSVNTTTLKATIDTRQHVA